MSNYGRAKQKTSTEMDTGAVVSVMSSAAKDKLFPDLKPKATSVILTTYTSEKVSVSLCS